MVAITVAIAATVYVYVSGMIGGTTEKTPSISFTKSDADNTLTVVTADTGILWENMEVFDNGTWVEASTLNGGASADISAGDTLSPLLGDQTVRIRWMPTNTLIGEWVFTA
jgi:FlaG/FlaF family flagellin (archaellin)